MCDVRCVEGCGYSDDDVRREQFAAVVGPHGDGVLDFCGSHFTHDSVDFEGQIDVLGAAVAHQLKLAVRRDEADGAVAVELRELHALMKLAVFERHAASFCTRGFPCAGDVAYGTGVCTKLPDLANEELVVEPELAFGGAREVGTHNDLACHVGAKNGAGGRHEEIDVFDYVDEGFVLAVLDVASPPGLGASGLRGDAGGFNGGSTDGADDIVDVIGRDVKFEDVDVRVLGIAEI